LLKIKRVNLFFVLVLGLVNLFVKSSASFSFLKPILKKSNLINIIFTDLCIKMDKFFIYDKLLYYFLF